MQACTCIHQAHNSLSLQQRYRSPARRSLCVAQARKSSKKALSSVTQGLLTVLKDELKIEKERYRTPEAVLEGPPEGFELRDKPNTHILLLNRSMGKEEIAVQIDLEDQAADDTDLDEEEDEEEGGALLPPVSFTVWVGKGDVEGSVRFECETDGRSVQIKSMALQDLDDEEDEEEEEEEDEDEEDDLDTRLPSYKGPVFAELDETLQQALLDYLEERGIGPAFGAYVVELVADKLEVEYMNWLGRMTRFVSS